MKNATKKASRVVAEEHKCICGGMGPALTEVLEQLRPNEDVRKHFDTARVEFLKGVRALLDTRIAELSSKQSRGTRVKVE
jgi:hypothetical protein